MSLPKDGGDVGGPAALAPSGGGSARPREGSRNIQKEGKIISVPDDWCHSPIKIVPYPIWAWQSDASNLANTVRQTDDRSHAKHSVVLMCFGDEKGVGGGVISHTHNGACWPKTWSETVRFEGRNAVRHDDEWWMNNRNTWGKLQYTKNMGNYGLPKVSLIQSDIAPISTREDDEKASADGTKVAAYGSAGKGSPPGSSGPPYHTPKPFPDPGPLPDLEPEEKDEDGLSTRSIMYNAKKAFLQLKTKTGIVRISRSNPCWRYACGKIPSLYRGGAYGCVKGHHMPADSISPLPRSAGPAIQMDEEDHKQTESYGSTVDAKIYRGAQLHLI